MSCSVPKSRGRPSSICAFVRRSLVLLLVFLFESSYSSNGSVEELVNRAESFYSDVKFDSSIALGERALILAQSKTGTSDSAMAAILLDIGKYQFAKEAYTASSLAIRQAVQILERNSGCCSREVLAAKVKLAEAERFAGARDQADSLLKHIISQAAAIQGSEVVLADAYSQMGIGHRVDNEFDSALADFAKALAFYDLSLGDHAEQRRSIAISQGRILIWKSNYTEGETIFVELIPSLKWTTALDSLSLAESYYNLGQAQRMLGKYGDAEANEKNAIAIREKVLGARHYLTGEATYGLAMVYQDQAQFDDCKPLLDQVLAIYRSSVGDDNYRVAGVLRNLARLHDDLGQSREAESLYVAAVVKAKRSLKPGHIGIAQRLTELAEFYVGHQKYAKAEPLLRQALQIQERSLGTNHNATAATLDGLGQVYFAQGKYGEALIHFQRALSICESIFGPQHPNDALCLQNIGEVYLKQGRHDEAGRAFEAALAIDRTALSDEHPLTADCLEESSHYRFAVGDYRGALEDAKSAFCCRRKSFIANCQVLSEADALKFSQKMRSSADKYLAGVFSLSSRDPVSTVTACDVILATKGEVSDEMFARRKSLVSTNGPSLQRTWKAYLQARRELSDVFIEQSRTIMAAGSDSTLASLNRTADSLESQLALQSAEFRRVRARQDVTTSLIRSLIPKHTVLVEYMKCNFRDMQNASLVPHYLVAVMEQERVTLLKDLGPSRCIDSVTGLYAKHFRSVAAQWPNLDAKAVSEADDILGYLYRKVFQPLQEFVQDHDLVLVSPDGALNLISFGSLRDTDGKYLIERYRIHYLSAARDLLRFREKGVPGSGLLALGDPDFEAVPNQCRQLLHEPSADGRMSTLQFDDKYLDSKRNVRVVQRATPLPYTRREVERLSHLWETLGSGPAEVLVGPDASEERFKCDAPGKRMIHLATHGFCNPDRRGDQLPIGEDDETVPLRNPLLSSGLLLAGANLRGIGSNGEGNEDGFLTADEIAGMDFSGTQCVVLSACETGLGQIETGEGVYGMRRAFQVAGVRTVVSSLWQVPDKETSSMMEHLYAVHDGDLSEAMREMALGQIAENRSRNLPDHPYLWGAFIAVGDWRVVK
jgi:CHAT domain-containing protein/tetratricopeptide (TPR) repeat protein